MSVRSSRSTTEKASYKESGMRWMERQEAHSLRRALEDMDEQKVYDDARDEAAELVWKHQNPNVPYPYTAHLRKGSHARAQSYDTASHHSSGDSRISSGGSKSSSVKSQKTPEPEPQPEPPRESKKSYGSISKGHVSFNIPPPTRRRTSSGSRRKTSGSLFKNPNDKIYEEPEEVSSKDEKPSKLPTHTRRNPFSRARDNLGRSNTDPPMSDHRKLWDRFEIHRNPPSQSRNAGYTSNEGSPAATPPPKSENEAPVEEQKDGKEIRGDDIRAATSMRLKDRSSKLPTPSMVSDSPGRPIVSFQKDYKPKEIELKEGKLPEPVEPKAYPPSPTKSISAPVVPTINMPDVPFSKAIPVINFPDESPIPSINVSDSPSTPVINVTNDQPARRPLPSINLPDDPPTPVINVTGDKPAQRPLPTINAPSTSRPLPNPATAKGRPLPRHANTAPVHRTPTSVRTTALCEACAQPIAGRIVSAAGARFHPECFLCYHCGEALECVAFYPEPDAKRAERVERIEARMSGYDVPVEWPSAEEDGDAGLRFYCHLDYHEMFSPRCKSCKTPIEGEVVVACGAEWHVGHFFCAQCGDPFDSSTPFVEKDGYAWCVDCHTNRYSTKCKKCRKPVTDTVLKALGAEWHPDCFVCTECSAPFDDGRYFLRGATKDPVCVRCEERRLKA
ncbi:hypothetical protein IWX90DRAFT_384973 [Phyllosticta citrichinensis]|uniref:LIM zinc-binding domain-containing protein n=1 Tax=Phyllosticta citrichinensis TaxID=1130410 RepID=A0ABR1XVG2_9PEZI